MYAISASIDASSLCVITLPLTLKSPHVPHRFRGKLTQIENEYLLHVEMIGLYLLACSFPDYTGPRLRLLWREREHLEPEGGGVEIGSAAAVAGQGEEGAGRCLTK